MNQSKIILLIGKALAISFVCALFLEVFFFNYRYFESKSYKSIDGYDVSIGPGLTDNGDGSYVVTDSQNAWVELSNIDGHISNIYLDVFDPDMPSWDNSVIELEIFGTDDGNSEYFKLPETEIVHGIDSSLYKRLYLIGNSSKLKVRFRNWQDRSLWLNRIGLNVKRKFELSTVRAIFCGLFIFFLILFRPRSFIYDIPLEFKGSKNSVQRLFIISIIAAYVGIIIIGSRKFDSKDWMNDPWKAHLQYNYLAESLLEGHTWLNIEPPKALLDMDNPYDIVARDQALSESGEEYVVDFAWYNGKYYCYFGVVPVFLFFIPYLVLTGEQLYRGALLSAACIAFGIVAFWFVYTVAKKYYDKVSLGLYLLVVAVLLMSSQMLYCFHHRGIYSVPILLCMVFNLFGLTCWLNASKNEKLNKGYLLLGAISIALTIGTRPAHAAVVLLAFPIFWKEIKDKKFFSKKGFMNTLAVMGPFFVVGFGIMYYNFIRFGNVFDFGDEYMLNSYDMTHRGFILQRWWLGFFEYFFQPLNIIPKFPYISAFVVWADMPTDYLGQIINEPFLGGYFALNSIGVFLLALVTHKQEMKGKRVWGISVGAVLIGALIVALGIQRVGYTLRYMSDFSLYISIALVFCLFAVLEKRMENSSDRIIWYTFVALAVVCVLVNSWALFADGRFNNLRESAPGVFYAVKYMSFPR